MLPTVNTVYMGGLYSNWDTYLHRAKLFFAPVSNYVGYFTIGVRGDCVLFGDISALVSFSAN